MQLWISREYLQASMRALNCCLEMESAIPWCYCMEDLWTNAQHVLTVCQCKSPWQFCSWSGICLWLYVVHPQFLFALYFTRGCSPHCPGFWGCVDRVTLRLDPQLTCSSDLHLCEAEHTHCEIRNMLWDLHTKLLLTNASVAVTCAWNWVNGLKSAVRKQ